MRYPDCATVEPGRYTPILSYATASDIPKFTQQKNNMTKSKTISVTVIATLLAVVIAAVAFAWSGLYPVAASSGHTAPVDWLLETTRKRSVAVRASDLVVPEDLGSSERIADLPGIFRGQYT